MANCRLALPQWRLSKRLFNSIKELQHNRINILEPKQLETTTYLKNRYEELAALFEIDVVYNKSF